MADKKDSGNSCIYCGNVAGDVMEAEEHYRVFHEHEDRSILDKPICPVCKKRFQYKRAIEGHVVKFHKRVNYNKATNTVSLKVPEISVPAPKMSPPSAKQHSTNPKDVETVVIDDDGTAENGGAQKKKASRGYDTRDVRGQRADSDDEGELKRVMRDSAISYHRKEIKKLKDTLVAHQIKLDELAREEAE